MTSVQQVLLSPAELAYLHKSLSQPSPNRPDGRSPTQFRPLTAETGILPQTNGSARVCFVDGSEAIVGIKAEIAKTEQGFAEVDEDSRTATKTGVTSADDRLADTDDEVKGRNEWLDISVQIPGCRDDDATAIFVGSMLSEALLADKEFPKKLYINRRFHWKVYIDIILNSQQLSYPLPLLSLATHLALVATRLPRLKSEGDEDPMFDDDWDASTYIYPRGAAGSASRPPITVLLIAVGDNIFCDPAMEELAVAETVLAISFAEYARPENAMDEGGGRDVRLLSMRMLDPPSRLTPPGVANSENPAMQGPTSQGAPSSAKARGASSKSAGEGLWKAPVGGTRFSIVEAMIEAVVKKGGVADEVLDGIAGVSIT